MEWENEHFFDGKFGIERETLRVDSEGRLAKTSHPFANPHLSRDFCENQLEIVTSPNDTIAQTLEELKSLDKEARELLVEQGESLWLSSNPPHFDSEDEIIHASYSGELASKSKYRELLEQKYGKKLMLYCGIHFNFSFTKEYLFDKWDKVGSFFDFKNDFYFKLMKQCFRYSWLLVLLTSASPIYDKSFEKDGQSGLKFSGRASMRNSDVGYWNKFIPVLDYTSVSSYVESVSSYVLSGKLISPGELYLPVRLKPEGRNTLESLKTNGINHIELRMFDINPLSEIGIYETDLKFAHMFMLYLSSLPNFEFTEQLQKTAVKNHKAAAEFDIDAITINGYPAKAAAMGLLDDMSWFYKGCAEAQKIIDLQKIKISQDERYCVKILNQVKP